jgi:hypothetical protein
MRIQVINPWRITHFLVLIAMIASLLSFAPQPPVKAVAPSCAQGGICLVGETGPAGGIVIYVGSSTINQATGISAGGKYLEAAPAGFSTTKYSWCNGPNNGNTTLIGANNASLGAGASNTATMVAKCETGAGNVAANYSKNGYLDWFLPSTAELEFLNSQKVAIGMNVNGIYWGSNETLTFAAAALVAFNNAVGDLNKGELSTLWPIRAFSPGDPMPGTICDGSTPCAIGDTGPGGGVIFYAAPALFDCGATLTQKCKYLEYARTTGTDPWTDVRIAWSGETSTAIGTTSAAIGTGYKNTLAMVTQPGGGNTANRAGTLTQAHRGPNYLTDWYLPSFDELEELRAQSSAFSTGFGGLEYWSSTEFSSRAAAFITSSGERQDVFKEDLSPYVRPIRAFGSGNFINCGTSGTFRIESNVVTGNTSCVGSVTIPSGITSIADDAFSGNSQITSVTIPNTVTIIGVAAFYGTTKLVSMTFASGSALETLGASAFERSGITSLAMPNSVVNLGTNTFLDATSLTTVALPSGITSIPGSFFNSATALSSITIPSSVTNIDTNAFANTPVLTSYTYCGTALSDSVLNNAGLGGKTRNSCAQPVVHVAPTPVPYLRTITAPKINLKAGKLVCTAGTYRAGYTLDGVTQGSATALFTPSTFTYNLMINGVAQISLSLTSSTATATWELPTSTSGSLLSCSVTVSANGVTNTDKSTDNTSALSSATSTLTTDNANADAAYTMAQSANAKAYQKALVDNRANWRTEIAAIRTNYFDTVARINTQPKSAATNKKMIADKSTALKVMIAAQKKSAADYRASQPAAAAARDAANKAALDAKTASIAKANAAYGTFIESIGYGVLIP